MQLHPGMKQAFMKKVVKGFTSVMKNIKTVFVKQAFLFHQTKSS
ncbi:hypothetical protein Hanom_Chr07g00598761 [Helianthus anomalus]